MIKKILSSLLAVIMLLSVMCSFPAIAENYSTVSGKYNYDYAMQILKLVNAERNREGHKSLVLTRQLTEAAMIRAAEQVKGMSHTRPNGKDCYSAFKWQKAGGENVAELFPTPESVFEAWMNSPGHRKNIMSDYYTLMGVGCFFYDANGYGYWAQAFSGGSDKEYTASGTKDVNVTIGMAPNTETKCSTVKDESTYTEGGVKGDTTVPQPKPKSVYVTKPQPTYVTNMAKGASTIEVDGYVTGISSEADPKDSSFINMSLKQGKTTKNSVALSWTKPAGAKYFIVYSNMSGSNYKYKKRATVTSTSYNVTGLFSNTYYKFMVCAFDANYKLVAASIVDHSATEGGKNGNPKSLTTAAKKNKVTLAKKGKKFKLKAKAVAPKKRKIKNYRKVSYESSNPSVASVDSKGVIKANKKGSCNVYVYAQNGISKTIKVKVKK